MRRTNADNGTHSRALWHTRARTRALSLPQSARAQRRLAWARAALRAGRSATKRTRRAGDGIRIRRAAASEPTGSEPTGSVRTAPPGAGRNHRTRKLPSPPRRGGAAARRTEVAQWSTPSTPARASVYEGSAGQPCANPPRALVVGPGHGRGGGARRGGARPAGQLWLRSLYHHCCCHWRMAAKWPPWLPPWWTTSARSRYLCTR